VIMKATQTYMFACWLGRYNATNKTKFRPGTATPEMIRQYASETRNGKSWEWYTEQRASAVMAGAIVTGKVM